VLLLFFGGYLGARATGLWHNALPDREYVERVQQMEGPGYGHPGMGGR
jgi:hypothetical protein